MAKVSRSITIDNELLKLSIELLPNRSKDAEQGILDAVLERLKSMKPEIAEQHRKRIAHLITSNK